MPLRLFLGILDSECKRLLSATIRVR